MRDAFHHIAYIYEYYKLPISDVAVCFEIENSSNSILFFEGSLFLERTKMDGLSYCSHISSKSRIIFLKDHPGINYDSVANQLVHDFFLAEFGFSEAGTQQMILQAIESKYPDVLESQV